MKKKQKEEPKADFELDILYKIHDQGKINRRTRVIMDFKSGDITLPPEAFASMRDFNSHLAGAGDYFYGGDYKYLKLLIQDAFAADVPDVYLLRKTGYINSELWITKDYCFYKGKAIKKTGDIYWVVRDELGYQLEGLKDKDADSTSSFDPDVVDSRDTVEIQSEFIELLIKNVGINGLLALAWMHSTVYSSAIHAKFHEFPMLFIAGRTQSGKNVLGRMLNSVLGFNNRDGESITSSMVGIERRLSYYNSLPYWIDEYRGGDKKTIGYDSLLRSVYARGSVSKGTKNEFGLRTSDITASLMVTGESLPLDPALRSRFVVVQLRKESRDDTVYPKLEAILLDVWTIGYKWIQERTATDPDQYLQMIKDSQRMIRNKLPEVNEIDRLSFCYAVVSASAIQILNECGLLDKYGKAFRDHILQHIVSEYAERQDSSLVSEWWADFMNLLYIKGDAGLLKGRDYELDYTHLDIPYSLVQSKISKWRRNSDNDDSITKSDLRKYLIQELRLTESNTSYRKRIGDFNVRCLHIPLADLPDNVRSALTSETEDYIDNSEEVEGLL